jgi:hypothetical protein
MEGDRQGVGTDKEGGGKSEGGDTGRGTDREGGHREGIQTRRGYEQGGNTDRMRGGRRSWNRGGGGSPSSVRARGWWLWWALVARCCLRVVMGVRSWSFVRGGRGRL